MQNLLVRREPMRWMAQEELNPKLCKLQNFHFLTEEKKRMQLERGSLLRCQVKCERPSSSWMKKFSLSCRHTTKTTTDSDLQRLLECSPSSNTTKIHNRIWSKMEILPEATSASFSWIKGLKSIKKSIAAILLRP